MSIFSGLFEKRVDIFRKKDKETWLKVKKALREAGFNGVSAGHYLQDSVMAGGCGAKLDPRDFGARGKIDHDIYFVKVRAQDEAAAKAELTKRGIVAEVKSQKELMTDAALRIKSDH